MAQKDVQTAVRRFLEAVGHPPRGELRQTPSRVATLWTKRLLAGESMDPQIILRGGMRARSKDPICVSDVGIHMVCPHHLTVAFGTAHVGYVPGDRMVGFGTISELVRACTARIVLQEDATADIADALMEHLGASAAVASLRATHPCHNLTHPRAHRSEALTRTSRGPKTLARSIQYLLDAARGEPKERK